MRRRVHKKRFNSTLVRLRPIDQNVREALVWSFNSTLVRLRRDSKFFFCRFLLLFQFHVGSIKTRERSLMIVVAFNVSIPRWFD